MANLGKELTELDVEIKGLISEIAMKQKVLDTADAKFEQCDAKAKAAAALQQAATTKLNAAQKVTAKAEQELKTAEANKKKDPKAYETKKKAAEAAQKAEDVVGAEVDKHTDEANKWRTAREAAEKVPETAGAALAEMKKKLVAAQAMLKTKQAAYDTALANGLKLRRESQAVIKKLLADAIVVFGAATGVETVARTAANDQAKAAVRQNIAKLRAAEVKIKAAAQESLAKWRTADANFGPLPDDADKMLAIATPTFNDNKAMITKLAEAKAKVDAAEQAIA